MIRRWISCLLVLSCLIVSASAVDIVSISVILDGEPLEDGGFLYNEMAYIPLEAFTERLGATLLPAPHRCGYMVLYQGHTFRYLLTESRAYMDGKPAEVKAHPLWRRGATYVPVRAFEAFLGLRLLYDQDYQALYVSSGAGYTLPEKVKLPILMYHAVADETWGSYPELFVRPAELEEQIVYLLKNGYTPITFDDLPNLSDYEKPVMLTFDDGYRDNYTTLFPVLLKYNVPATIFVVTNNLDDPRCVTPDMVREMNASGLVSVQSHSHTHPELTALSEDSLAYEFMQSRLRIARLTGKVPYVFCYPSGKQNAKVREIAAKYYEYGLVMGGDTLYTGRIDAMRWTREYVRRGMSLSNFKNLL